MEITVKSKYVKTTPRKLRLVADLVRGWQAERAINQLRFIPKTAARDITKTLQSAIASARDSQMDLDKTYIHKIMINEGPRLKRRVPVSKGRATPIQKQMSHIIIGLTEKDVETKPTRKPHLDKKETKPAVKEENPTTAEAGKENHGA